MNRNLILGVFAMVFSFTTLSAQNTVKFCDVDLKFGDDCEVKTDEKKTEVIASNFVLDVFYLNHWENIETPVTAYIDFLEIDNFEYQKKVLKLNINSVDYEAILFTLDKSQDFPYRLISYGKCGENKFLVDISLKESPEENKLPEYLKRSFKLVK